MLPPRKSISRPGSHSKRNTKSSFLVLTVPTTNPAPLKFDVASRSNSTRQRDTFTVSTERYVPPQGLSVASLKTTRQKTYSTLLCKDNVQGVNVPEVLRPYLGGLKFIPYTRDLPKNTTSQKRGVPTKTKSAHEIAKGPVV